MKRITTIILTATVLLVSQAGLFAQNAVDIMTKSLTAMGNAKTMTYHFFAQERMNDGKYSKSDVEFKVIASPVRIYANAHLPQSAQLIYEPAKSPKVSVKKGLKLSLSPTSGLLMKGVHNPVTRAGFGQIKKILEMSIAQRKGQNYADFVKLVGIVNYDGKDCYKIELTDPDYKIVDYTVGKESTVWDIGNARAISEYKIKELNNINDEVTAGQKLKIPSSYAKKTTLYIDKNTYLPIYHKMEDEKGIYEIYEFKDLKLGVALADVDFTFQ
jgi:outer membrane lipoprotein-sorting protein